MNFYPEQLRRIADMCEALNKVDGADIPETAGTFIGFKQPWPVVDGDGTVYGTLRDEVGGAWSFEPKED